MAENTPQAKIGSYTLTALLGQGGMGAVYEGFQESTQRRVAIKVLPENLAAEAGYLERFEREVKLAASLEHIHILPVYDYGSQDGQSYIVMRLLTGGDLAVRLRKLGRPPISVLRRLLTQIASALDYAHKRGVVHRDLKTNNIMFDDEGNAYLADFGIAKAIGSTGMTGTGQAIGTPYYMAPEQVRGEAVDHRADIYAFGILAYELLAGKLPFTGDNAVAVMFKQVSEYPTPLTELLPHLPPEVDTIFMRVLAKEPEVRYASAGDFAAALNAVLTNVPDESGAPLNYMTVHVDTGKTGKPFTARSLLPTGARTNITGRRSALTEDSKSPPSTQSRDNRPLYLGFALVVLALLIVAALLLASMTGEGETELDPAAAAQATVNRQLTIAPELTQIALRQTPPAADEQGEPAPSPTRPTSTPTPTPFSIASVNSGSITDNAAWKPLERVDSFGVLQVLVPAGCFMMGSDESEYPDVQPAHEQCIKVAFWLDKTETTRAQYAQCVLAGACQPRTPDTASNSDEQPINNLTWEQARAYCLWRASSLPSEPQWEYAARGPSNLLYPWGADFVSDNVVWQSNSVRKSVAVGSRPAGASWVGALDMLGNIGEWMSSLYATYPYVREDGREVTSAEGQRVVRGGTFEDSRRFISTLFRKPFEANSSSTFYGVRCVTLVN